MRKLSKKIAWLNNWKMIWRNEVGSPTVEYIILIGVGALVATLLAMALSPENNGDIVDAIVDKIEEIIDRSTTIKEE